MAEYRALRERHSLLELCRTPDLATRSDAAAGSTHRRRRGDPLLRPAAAARADGPPLRLRQRRRAAHRAAAPHRQPTSTGCSCSSRARRSATCSTPIRHDPARARRPRAADRLRRRAVHAGVLRHRGRPLEQLRPHQGADVRRSRGLAPALRQAGRRWSRDYLVAQIDAGAEAVQLFDSWVGALYAERLPRVRAAPHRADLRRASAEPACRRSTSAPAPRRSCADLREAGGDVIGVDWRMPLDEAWEQHRRRSRRSRATSIPTLLLGPRASHAARGATTCSGARPDGPATSSTSDTASCRRHRVEHVQALARFVHGFRLA